MRFNRELRLQVLNLLHENLKNPEPQVVSVDNIAWQLEMNIKEAKQLLLSMDQSGEIQSDMEGNYSLITKAGLSQLKQQGLSIAA